MKFKLEKIVELEDPKVCDGCPFECVNESSDMYCAAMQEGDCITKPLPDKKRPAWCPLKEVKEEHIVMRLPAGYGGLGNVP